MKKAHSLDPESDLNWLIRANKTFEIFGDIWSCMEAHNGPLKS